MNNKERLIHLRKQLDTLYEEMQKLAWEEGFVMGKKIVLSSTIEELEKQEDTLQWLIKAEEEAK